MPATHPDAVWLNVARSSARTAATRRRLHRQFEFFDVLGNPTIIGLTEVHRSSVTAWRAWAQARGYHVTAGRFADRLPTTALLFTAAERTVRQSERIASTPRRTAQGWASWLEMHSVLVELDRTGPLRVGNASCRDSHRTALNFYQSCVDTPRFVVGGDFDLTARAQPHIDRRTAMRAEIRWIAAHTPFVDVPASGPNTVRGPADTWRAGSPMARRLNHVFADAGTAADLRVRVADAIDGDGAMSDYRALIVDDIAATAAPSAFDALPRRQATRRGIAPPTKQHADRAASIAD